MRRQREREEYKKRRDVKSRIIEEKREKDEGWEDTQYQTEREKL